MSDFGLLIVNEAGETQIDGTYKNLMEFETGTATLDMWFENYLFDIPFDTPFDDANIAFPAFKLASWDGTFPNTGACQVKGLTSSGGNYTGFSVEAMVYGFMNPGVGFRDLDWIVYRDLNTHPIPEFGLMVKNVDNEIVYTSEEKPFIINNVYTGTYEIGDGDVEITVEDAVNHWFTILPAASWSYASFNLVGQWFRGIRYKNASTLVITEWEKGTINHGKICPPLTTNKTAWVDDYVILEIEQAF
jgi:hypothetical protein